MLHFYPEKTHARSSALILGMFPHECQYFQIIPRNTVPLPNFPFEAPTFYIRKDEVSHVLNVSDAMKNAPHVSEDYIVVPKVVK